MKDITVHTKEVSEILHKDWPDPSWVRGFSVAIRPFLDINPQKLHEIMTTEDILDIEPLLARNNFDTTQVSRSENETRILVVRDSLHCGMLGSSMHKTALKSLNIRLDMLLSE